MEEKKKRITAIMSPHNGSNERIFDPHIHHQVEGEKKNKRKPPLKRRYGGEPGEKQRT